MKPLKGRFVHRLQQPFGLGRTTSEDHDIAVKRSPVFKRNLASLDRVHLAIRLDEHTDFIQRRGHPSNHACPSFTDHRQPALLQPCVPVAEPHHARVREQCSSCGGVRSRVCLFQLPTELRSQSDVVAWAKRANTDDVEAVHSWTGEHDRQAADLLHDLHQRASLVEQMQAVTKGRAVHGLGGCPSTESVGSVEHHHMMTCRNGIQSGGQAGDACTNHRHSNHGLGRGCE